MIAANESKTFNPSGWTPPLVPTSTTPPPTSQDVDLLKLIGALKRISSDDYQTWMRVGLALKHQSEDLYAIWEWWSKLSTKSNGCDLHTEWDHLDPRGDVTLGTIYHLGRADDAPKFETYTLDHLLDGDFRVTYLIEGVLVAGQPCLCVGPQKSLKTTMLLYMALCLSMGKPFLGRPCKKSRVLFMSGESGMATLQETAARMVKHFGGEYDSDSFRLSPNLPRFDQPLDELEKLLTEHEIEVLFIDPAYLCLAGGEAGNMFVMGQQLKAMADLCTELKITLVLAHHSTKSAGRENKPLELSDMAWAGFGEFARQWLMLSRRASYVDGTGEHKLYLRAGGSAGHSNLLNIDVSEGVYPDRHWRIDSQSACAVACQEAVSQYELDCQRVLDTLQEAGRPLCKTPLRDATGINKGRFPDVLAHMLADGRVIEVGKSNGRPTYFTPEDNQ